MPKQYLGLQRVSPQQVIPAATPYQAISDSLPFIKAISAQLYYYHHQIFTMLSRRIFTNTNLLKAISPKFTRLPPTLRLGTFNSSKVTFPFCTCTTQHLPQTAPPLVAEGKEKLVGIWLFLTAAAVLGMIVLGGYTRLTHSGLSMADWAPYTKSFPKNDAEWQVEFQKYKKCVEYQTVNRQMSLEKFKPIYWVEFFHRQMGMALGYLFMIPFSIFWYKGYLMPKMRNRLLGMLCLGGLQGAIGWWMVKSGLNKKAEYQSRPRVSPYRLATHLGMATTLYTSLIWNSFALLIKPTHVDPSDTAKIKYLRSIRIIGIVLIKCLILNILTGAFVAGIDAGRVYNTWPLMNGNFVPPSIVEKQPFWKNFFENVAMVQFNHRNMAYITMSMSWYLFYKILRSKVGGRATVAGLVVVAVINYQALSGILTLLNLVPRDRANMHQMTAVITLTSVLLMCYLARVPLKLPPPMP